MSDCHQGIILTLLFSSLPMKTNSADHWVWYKTCPFYFVRPADMQEYDLCDCCGLEILFSCFRVGINFKDFKIEEKLAL